MRRNIVVRGKSIALDELENIVAVRFDSPETVQQVKQGTHTALWRGQRLVLASVPNFLRGIQDGFLKAGWVLMEPADAAYETSNSVQPIAIGRIFRDKNGEFAIGTANLTVRLRDNLQGSAATNVLAKHGLRVKRQLKFAPNLFEAEAESPEQALSVASEAADDRDILYAEPQMLRNISGRR